MPRFFAGDNILGASCLILVNFVYLFVCMLFGCIIKKKHCMEKLTTGWKGYCSSKIIFSMADLLLSSVHGSKDQTC